MIKAHDEALKSYLRGKIGLKEKKYSKSLHLVCSVVSKDILFSSFSFSKDILLGKHDLLYLNELH